MGNVGVKVLRCNWEAISKFSLYPHYRPMLISSGIFSYGNFLQQLNKNISQDVVDDIHSSVVILRVSTFTGNSRASVTFDIDAGNYPFLVHSYLSFVRATSLHLIKYPAMASSSSQLIPRINSPHLFTGPFQDHQCCMS